MNDLFDSIKNSKIIPLSKMTGAKLHAYDKHLSLDINYDATPFEKSIEKDYALEENIYLAEEFQYIFNVHLNEYGFKFEGQDELETRFGDGSHDELNYKLDRVDLYEKIAFLKGGVFGDALHLTNVAPLLAKLTVFGITKADAKKMDLYQELIVEAHVLEVCNSLKMSFFSYFSAIEALLVISLDSFKNTLPKELHEPLEHLPIDNKVRVAAKCKLSISDLNSVTLWGSFMSQFTKTKKKRNDIAHGKNTTIVSQDDVDSCFLSLSILHSILLGSCTTFTQVRKYIYPKSV
jgi:hypothetical protein